MYQGIQSEIHESNNIQSDSTVSLKTLNDDFVWMDNNKKIIAFYNADSLLLHIGNPNDFHISHKLCNTHLTIIGVMDNNKVDEVTVKVIQSKATSSIKLTPPSITLNDLFAHLYFKNNEFEPSPNDNTIPQSTPLRIDETKKLLKYLALSSTITISTSLFSRGIGEEKSDLSNGLNNESCVSKSINQNDREFDNGSNANYAQRRYSYTNIGLFPSHLEIYIESFVSPLRCTWGDPNPFPGNPIGFNTIIQDLAVGTPKKIYNHVLSGLRSLGTLEYITDQLCNIAEDMKSNGDISSSEKDDLISKIQMALNQSSVDIFDKDGILRGSITYTDYLTKIKP